MLDWYLQSRRQEHAMFPLARTVLGLVLHRMTWGRALVSVFSEGPMGGLNHLPRGTELPSCVDSCGELGAVSGTVSDSSCSRTSPPLAGGGRGPLIGLER